MSLSEFLIIYLACGAPLAVHVLMRRERLSPASVFRLCLTFLFWPAIGLKLLAAGRQEAADAEGADRLDEIRLEIEEIALSGRSLTAHFQFREIFHRYTGLFEMCEAAHVPRDHSAFTDIAGHTRPAIAAACLSRINAAKVLGHAAGARLEFIDSLAFGNAADGRLRELTIEAMLLAGDDEGASLISGQAVSERLERAVPKKTERDEPQFERATY